MKRNFRSGLSLIEVVIAMAIIVVVAVALVSTTIFTQKTSRSASAQTQAAKLAEENIEQIRVLRDRKGFQALDVGSCLTLYAPSSIALWDLVPCTLPDGEQITLGNFRFNRKVGVVNSGPDKKEVTVTVSWEEPGGIRTVSTVTYFSRTLTGS